MRKTFGKEEEVQNTLAKTNIVKGFLMIIGLLHTVCNLVEHYKSLIQKPYHELKYTERFPTFLTGFGNLRIDLLNYLLSVLLPTADADTGWFCHLL